MSFCRALIAMASIAIASVVRMLSCWRYLVMLARDSARDNGFTPFIDRNESSCWLIAAV